MIKSTSRSRTAITPKFIFSRKKWRKCWSLNIDIQSSKTASLAVDLPPQSKKVIKGKPPTSSYNSQHYITLNQIHHH